jgi:hypothetical protein
MDRSRHYIVFALAGIGTCPSSSLPYRAERLVLASATSLNLG